MMTCRQSIPASTVTNMELTGYVGYKVRSLIERWVPDMLEKNPNIIEAIDLANHGRGPIDSPYTGRLLEQNEFFGKHLTGLTYCYAATHDPMVRAEAERLIGEMNRARGEDGYMGVHARDDRFGGHIGDQDNWDIWGHYHAISALLAWHRLTGDPLSLQMAKDGAELCLDYFKDKSYEIGFYSVNYAITHAYALMYQATGDARYLAEAKRIIENDWPKHGNWFADALAGKDLCQSDLPRWEVLHSIMALSCLYETTGEQAYLDAFEHIWWSIVKTDRHNTGGFSTHEQAIGNPYAAGPIETCCTVAWIGMGVSYLRLSKNAYVADELELSYFNTILCTLTSSLREVTYDTPMEGYIVKSQTALPTIFNSGTPDFNCCQGNACRGFGEVSQWAALTDTDALYLNYYGPSTLHVTTPGGQKARLRVSGNYPVSGQVTITVEGLAREESFALCLRVPRWSEHTEVSVMEEAPVSPKPGAYLPLRRTWKAGDTIRLKLDMTLHCWVGEDRFAGRTAVYYGPILLAYDERVAGKPAGEASFTLEALKNMTVTAGDGESAWLTFDAEDTTGVKRRLVDFASAGKSGGFYTSWLRVAHDLSPLPFSRDGLPVWLNGLTK